MHKLASHTRQPAPFALLGLALLARAGCAVGPDYKAPATTVDSSFVSAGATATNAAEPGADIARFWQGFNDAALNALVERALAANGDVRIAQARLQEARSSLQGARAELLPSIGVAANAGRALQPEYLYPGTTRDQRLGNSYDAGFTASWELDFFGRNRRASEGAAALLDASQADLHAARRSVAAEVAANYIELRGLQQRLLVAQQALANQREALRLTSARFDAGRSNRLDLARVRGLVDTTEATLPVLQAGVSRAAYRLATLTAQAPRQVATTLGAPQLIPALPVTDLGALPVGSPEQLLRRRPDIVAAERQLAAATANIGVATADLFPRISLTGLLGFASNRVSLLGERDSEQFAIGAGLSWPLLDFGRVRARIGASEARAEQALARYEQTVSVALEETEGALSQFSRTTQQTGRLASAARNAEDAAQLARQRLDAGAVDLLTVLDAERQALSARDTLVQAQTGLATTLVSVYRALGGGWTSESAPVARAPS